MKIDLLCSSENHPINPWLVTWAGERARHHEVRILRHKDQLDFGDMLFLISCTEVVPAELRTRYRHCVVLHASDLPAGRGWSPHIWAILEGARTITVSAINAEDRIDSGNIWAKSSFDVAPHELYDEINASLFDTEIALLDRVIEMVENGDAPHPQPDEEATYYPRRTPRESELDPRLSIAEQFDKIRVSDPDRYPAFFEMYGAVFSVSLKKVQSHE
jgi:methionyl-tRNA formyltransferase